MSAELEKAWRWRRLAAEARNVAEGMNDRGAQQIMLSIARAYERLAAHVESSANQKK